MFLGQGLLWQQVWDCLRAIQGQSSTTLNTPHESSAVSGDTLRERTNRLKTTLSNLAVGDSDTSGTALQSSPKRRRTSNGKWSPSPMQTLPPHNEDSTLPPDDLIDGLVEIYFANIHPWIPILHVRQFRERMADPTQRQKLTTIFHAIVSVCVRFSEDPRLSSADVRMRHSRQSRKTVILQSMESFSVENLQALVICAFDIVSLPPSLLYLQLINPDRQWSWTISLVDCRKYDKDSGATTTKCRRRRSRSVGRVSYQAYGVSST